jgi:hypothetical protein
MDTSISELFAFIDIAEKKNFFNRHTIQSRRTACTKLFGILDEDQRTVEYVRDHLDVIKARFTNAHTEIRGNTVEVYSQRAALTMTDFLAWKADRAAWERDISARQGARASAADDAGRRPRADKARPAAAAGAAADDANVRLVKVPLPSGFEVEVRMPREMAMSDLKRILWALLPYARDWDPSESPRQTFPQLEARDDHLHQ